MLVLLALLAFVLLPAPWGVLAVVAAAALEVLELLFWKWFLRRYRLRVGPEMLVGERAVVIERCAPVGRVRIRGELWRARSQSSVEAGESVRISSINGLTLEVEPDPRP
jgi:membrane-bound serine protease (ClpP class)